ncbi:hypothetical protein WPS_27750 [Vulcanimicrobium alpinum]|uniref:Uncharacterized protein n=1 Tax=Vulcanimicrobium alpinum TaxID=3016050 RepID=A0AAN2CAL9_UNVUL|nr:hypothetical protein WPS_27750 [Vulcanimicrobium alpinum]
MVRTYGRECKVRTVQMKARVAAVVAGASTIVEMKADGTMRVIRKGTTRADRRRAITGSPPDRT